VAADNSLAINGEVGEPKEFFASAAVVGDANTELAAVNSPIGFTSPAIEVKPGRLALRTTPPTSAADGQRR
jgi:hypothetical protein